MDINDIGTVNEDDGVFVQFKTAAGAPLFEDAEKKVPSGALVAGSYSSFCLAAQRQVKKANEKLFQQGDKLTDEQKEDNNLFVESACIRSWTLTSAGKSYPITVDNWAIVSAKQPQWREAIQRTLVDHELFSPAS